MSLHSTLVPKKRFYSSKKNSVQSDSFVPNYIEYSNNMDVELVNDLKINQQLVEQIRSQLSNLNIQTNTQELDNYGTETYSDNESSDEDVITYVHNTSNQPTFNTTSPKFKINERVKVKTYYCSPNTNIYPQWSSTKSYYFYVIIDILYSNEYKKHIYILIDENTKPDDYYINGISSKTILQRYEEDLYIL